MEFRGCTTRKRWDLLRLSSDQNLTLVKLSLFKGIRIILCKSNMVIMREIFLGCDLFWTFWGLWIALPFGSFKGFFECSCLPWEMIRFDLSQIWSKRNRRNTVWGFVCDFGPQKQKPWNAHHVSKRAFCCLGLYRGWNPTLLYRHYYIVNHNKDPYETTRIYFLPPSSAGGFAVSWLQDMVFSQIGWTGVFGNPWGLKHKGFGTTWVFSIQRDRLPWKSLATIFV